MFDERIDYAILPDGTCSYCGREATLIEFPDGHLTRSDSCIPCDNYNHELELEDWWSRSSWLDGSEEPRDDRPVPSEPHASVDECDRRSTPGTSDNAL